ncbi:MAG: hypothetical protein IJT94_06430 [Oscillibacter sp.]|nr:hypothetical protein [Oscillibacter sp.]
MLTKEQLLDEAQKQKQALEVIGVWRRWLFSLTTVLLVLSAVGLQRSGAVFVLGVIAAVLTAVCFVLLLLVNLSIRNGHRNVERILDSLQS